MVLASADGSCVAVAHAGWQGLARGILAETIAKFPVAAGGLLVTEAGGEVGTLRPGGDWIRNGNIVAGAGPLVAELRDILSETQPEEWPFLGDAEELES